MDGGKDEGTDTGKSRNRTGKEETHTQQQNRPDVMCILLHLFAVLVMPQRCVKLKEDRSGRKTDAL